MSAVRVEDRGHVRILTLDNPPVNALSFGYSAELLKAIEAAESEAAVQAVVMTGANGIFSGGADINDFNTEPPEGAVTIRDVIAAIDRSEKTYVAAIDGNAMGGGVELALACDYRGATKSSKLGLPEIKLGLLPGAGGTQRLPRSIGAQAALEFMLKGDMHPAAEAKKRGILDNIAEGNVIDEAVAFLERIFSGSLATGDSMDAGQAKIHAGQPLPRKRRISGWDAFIGGGISMQALPFVVAQAHKMVPPENNGGFAAHKLIDAVEAALEMPFPFGIARESRLFEELVRSAPSLALRHIFFAERELAKIPGIEGIQPRTIEKAGIVGAGTMGTGIAITFANADIPVVVVEPAAEQVEKAKQMVFGMFMYQVQRGRMTQEEAWKRGQGITFTDAYEELADCDVVIEAVFENMDVKKQVFAKLDGIVKPDGLLATNTSTLDIDEMASVTRRPAAFLGLHFFAPANIMKLLEIVRGKDTSPETLATAFALAKRLRKVAVLSANAFGFIGNRMLFDYAREAVGLAERGVPPYRVDAAMKNFGFAMGPFAMFDLSGIDVMWHIQQAKPEMGAGRTAIVDRLVTEKRLGQKTGKGFYRYDKAVGSGREPIRDEDIERIFAEEAAKAGVAPQADVPDDEIVARLTGALATRGEQLLRDKVALRSGDIDVAYVYGYGFPPHHGGPMWYAQHEAHTEKERAHA